MYSTTWQGGSVGGGGLGGKKREKRALRLRGFVGLPFRKSDM